MDNAERKAIYEKVLGRDSAFHNPYTFIPFAEGVPNRSEPTPLTADEDAGESSRFTGIIEIAVTTVSPLMSCAPEPVNPNEDHKRYRALTIGNDVIVPATGVRGSLRTLLTILTGGTLGYIDEDLYLCQNRDLQLEVPSPSAKDTDKKLGYLARVVKPGSRYGDGVIELGETRAVKLDALQGKARFDVEKCRPAARGGENGDQGVFIDNPDNPQKVTTSLSQGTPWQVRLSGRPVNSKGKREGAFRANGMTATLPAELWRQYSGRNRHSFRPELRKGDLIWLEPRDGVDEIRTGADVQSIQWARWGRLGLAMKAAVPSELLPDYLKSDGKVDEVTNLFGQVSPLSESDAPSFAARVRPENLVFPDAAHQLMRDVTLAPLQPPHPGCSAFYWEVSDPAEDPRRAVRGYKVYRTTNEDGAWLYEKQGVYDEQGNLQPAQKQKVCKTVELLPPNAQGVLRIAVRALSQRELALVLQACSVPWRLGGGKPLGLGCCTPHVVRILDEVGEEYQLSFDWQARVPEYVRDGVFHWVASQQPVNKLRYPRAVGRNKNKISCGGHEWFRRHATPKANEQSNVRGFMEMHLEGALSKQAKRDSIPAQPLPEFDPAQPDQDLLFGYDLIIADSGKARDKRTLVKRIEPFDPARHVSGQERSGENTSPNRESRQRTRDERGRESSAGEAANTNQPASAAPVSELQKGATVQCRVCADPKGGPRLFAEHVASSRSGRIMDDEKVPAEKKSIGTELRLYVFICDAQQVQFRYEPPPPPKPRNSGRGGPRGRR